MSQSTCPRCGALRGQKDPEGLCPACVLESFVDSDGTPEPDDASPSNSTQPSSGHIFGAYRIERELGQGGMGTVYAAQHLGTGRRVALKVLRKQFPDARERARFLREGQLAASVNHPNSVYIFGCDDIDDTPVIIMELVAGGTLRDRVRANGPFDPTAAVDLVLQLADGLSAARAAGVLHRDIKPSNCFLDLDGTVKIGDYGLSISVESRGRLSQGQDATAFHGTPQYASPEHLRGDEVDERSDIYSLAATLYFLITGAPPFDEPNLVALVTRIATEPPSWPDAIRKTAPAELLQSIDRCLSKKAADRPASYEQLIRLFEPFRNVKPVAAAPAPRLAAAIVDATVLSLAPLALSPLGLVFEWGATAWATFTLFALAAACAYLAFIEARTGASYGKRINNLRVATAEGLKISLTQSLARNAILGGALALSVALVANFTSTDAFSIATGLFLSLALLASTARMANGYLGLHELLTDTRTVASTPFDEPRVPLRIEPPSHRDDATVRVGPYDVIVSLGPTDAGELFHAFDPALKRDVWLHVFAEGAGKSSLDPPTRATRLRWLGGQRLPHSGWDAYEAPGGQSFSQLVHDTPAAWSATRQLLLDLAHELASGFTDGTLDRLVVDRLWIAKTGTLHYLDFTIAGATSEPSFALTLPDAQRFLTLVAARALRGAPPASRPLSASQFLRKLARQEFDSIASVISALESLVKGPAELTERNRSMALALSVAGAVASGVVLGFALRPQARSLVLGTGLDADVVAYYLGDLLVGAFAVIAAALTRGGIALRLRDIAVVTEKGDEVSRILALYRAVLAWFLLPLQALAMSVGFSSLGAALMLARVFGLAWAHDHPARGLHDRIAGTFLVPR